MAAVQLLLFDFLYTTQVSRVLCSQDCATVSAFQAFASPTVEPMPTCAPRPGPAASEAEPTAERPVLQNGFFNNKLHFFQAFLSYLYLLSFVLHEDFSWDAGTIEPVRIFLQVIGIPAWSLPEV